MEEILELKELIQKRDYDGALRIVEELEEMSRDDIINEIRSHAVVLLLHLIKQQAENRSTKSWDISIRNSVREIKLKNKRRKAGLQRYRYKLDEPLTPPTVGSLGTNVNEGSSNLYGFTSRGNYLNGQELLETLEEAYPSALDQASLEVQGGRYESKELETIVDACSILDFAIKLLS